MGKALGCAEVRPRYAHCTQGRESLPFFVFIFPGSWPTITGRRSRAAAGCLGALTIMAQAPCMYKTITNIPGRPARVTG